MRKTWRTRLTSSSSCFYPFLSGIKVNCFHQVSERVTDSPLNTGLHVGSTVSVGVGKAVRTEERAVLILICC
ncbi:hypothetical protein MHYP_G00013470 [Metynnis hypsauchen]